MRLRTWPHIHISSRRLPRTQTEKADALRRTVQVFASRPHLGSETPRSDAYRSGVSRGGLHVLKPACQLPFASPHNLPKMTGRC
jgi:hypothetical protein